MQSSDQQKRMCKNCVNFIMYRNDNKVECDYDMFKDSIYENAILYKPELFDCEMFENINDI